MVVYFSVNTNREHVALQHNSNITNANALCHIIENDANQGEFYLNDNNTGFNNLEDIQLHCDTVTLTKEMSVPAQLLTIHPNPSSTDLYIEMDESVVFPARLQIVDRLGRIVRQETIESNAVSLPVYDLANGVYSLFLKSRDGEMRHTKFVKQR